MTITEASRHHLIERATQALGEDAAMTLAEHLPPVGWADVATKHDLAQLETRLGSKFEAIDHRFAGLEHKLIGTIHEAAASQSHTFIVALISTLIAFSGLALAAASAH